MHTKIKEYDTLSLIKKMVKKPLDSIVNRIKEEPRYDKIYAEKAQTTSGNPLIIKSIAEDNFEEELYHHQLPAIVGRNPHHTKAKEQPLDEMHYNKSVTLPYYKDTAIARRQFDIDLIEEEEYQITNISTYAGNKIKCRLNRGAWFELTQGQHAYLPADFGMMEIHLGDEEHDILLCPKKYLNQYYSESESVATANTPGEKGNDYTEEDVIKIYELKRSMGINEQSSF